MSLVALIALACATASCGSSGDRPPIARRVPIVSSPDVLAGEDIVVPPHVVALDAYGVIRVAEAPGKDVKVTALGRRDLPFKRTNLAALRQLRPQPERIREDNVGGLDRRALASTPTSTKAELPTRRGQVVGEVFDRAGMGSPFLVAAAPAAKAEALVDVLEASGGLVVVAHQGTLRALRIEFGIHATGRSGREPWLEVRLEHAGLEIEGVPDAYEELPWSSVDAAALSRILADVRARRGVQGPEVDVLVSDTTSAQRLIDVLVRLDEAGVRAVVLGRAPIRGTDEAALRGHRIISVRLGQPQANGDLDKAIIREVIKSHVPELRVCYEDALARDSSLTGTVATQFFISPHGTVAASNASGVNADVAACFAKRIKAIQFPRPKGGGGVQVNYPFNLRN